MFFWNSMIFNQHVFFSLIKTLLQVHLKCAELLQGQTASSSILYKSATEIIWKYVKMY